MALHAMGLDVGSFDFIWVHIIHKKLDKTTRQQWELYSRGGDLQSMNEMKKFLEQRAGTSNWSLDDSNKCSMKGRAN